MFKRICIRVHASNPDSARPYLHPGWPRTKRVPARVRTRERIGGATAHNGPPQSQPGRARPERLRWRATGPEGGAYNVHVRHGRGVPRADVRVEHRRLVERLRAEPHAVHAIGKRSHGSARIRVRPHPHPQARTHARTTCARTWRAHASAIRLPCSYAHGCSYVHVLCLSIPYLCVIHRSGLMERERRTRAYAVQSRIVGPRTRPHVRASGVAYSHERST